MNDGFDLSPELLEAIAPNVNPEDAQIKFDDMGTLHVLERDKEGSLKNDYALKDIEEKIVEDNGTPKNEQLRIKKADNNDSRAFYVILLVDILFITVSLVYLVQIQFNVKLETLVSFMFSIIGLLLCAIYCIWHLIKKYFMR